MRSPIQFSWMALAPIASLMEESYWVGSTEGITPSSAKLHRRNHSSNATSFDLLQVFKKTCQGIVEISISYPPFGSLFSFGEFELPRLLISSLIKELGDRSILWPIFFRCTQESCQMFGCFPLGQKRVVFPKHSLFRWVILTNHSYGVGSTKLDTYCPNQQLLFHYCLYRRLWV